MTIHLLSESTSRVLISTQTLHNAVSVIKELIDNALDARAVSIAVEIASNTIDKIVVRDDGTGIGVEDRQLLCKRGCTSKITDLDDLAKLGGTFLGFRGTALASVAELSRNVTVITRVDGEQPATTLTFGSDGKLLSSASASHNVGTTVRVEDFLTSVPVRKQAALKHSSKILDQIKKLVQSYALARPTVKLSLKVLKAKNDKFNWSFAACQEELQLLAAAAQVVGKATAGLCGTHSALLDEDANALSTFRINAVLLQGKTKELAECGNVGQFVSIDGRPVNQDKGVVKEFVKLYKSYLHNTIRSIGQLPAKPFLVAHIRCPSGSYDVNIEPAKDVVLFHDPSKLIDLAKKLFIDVYGELNVNPVEGQSTLTEIKSQKDPSSFDILSARKRPVMDVGANNGSTETNPKSIPTDSEAGSLVSSFARSMNRPFAPGSTGHSHLRNDCNSEDSRSSFANPYRTMSSMDDDLVVDETLNGQLEEPSGEVEIYDPNSVALNNPFVRAKLVSLKTPTRSPHIDSSLQQGQGTKVPTNSKSSPLTALSPINARQTPKELAHHLPTPLTSPQSIDVYQNPGPPFPRRSRQAHDDDYDNEIELELPTSTSRSNNQQTLLDPWAQRMIGGRSMLDTSIASGTHPPGETGRLEFSMRNARNSNTGERYQPGASIKIPNKPFRSPIKQAQPGLQHDIQADLTRSSSWRSRDPGKPEAAVDSSIEADSDLQNILAFELRKKALKQQQKMEPQKQGPRNVASVLHPPTTNLNPMSSARLPVINHAEFSLADIPHSFTARPDFTSKFSEDGGGAPRSSHTSNPHRNRYLAAIQNLESRQTGNTLTPTSNCRSSESGVGDGDRSLISKDDPRYYLIQVQNAHHDTTKSHLKVKKIHLSRLPFEVIPTESVKHDLLAIPTRHAPNIESLLLRCRTLSIADTYVKEGVVKPIHWSPISEDIGQWQESLEALVKEHYRPEAGPATEDRSTAFEPVPDVEIPLSRVIKAHVDSTGLKDNTNTNTKG